MQRTRTHWFINVLTALFFSVLASLLVIFATQVNYHDGNYPAFYLGFGVLLECLYLAAHFGLAALLNSKQRLAETLSLIFGLLLMVPLGLIIVILTMLLEQAIRSNLLNESELTLTNWIFGSLILLLLVAPAVLILRYIVCSLLDRRAEKL